MSMLVSHSATLTRETLILGALIFAFDTGRRIDRIVFKSNVCM